MTSKKSPYEETKFRDGFEAVCKACCLSGMSQRDQTTMIFATIETAMNIRTSTTNGSLFFAPGFVLAPRTDMTPMMTSMTVTITLRTVANADINQ